MASSQLGTSLVAIVDSLGKVVVTEDRDTAYVDTGTDATMYMDGMGGNSIHVVGGREEYTLGLRERIQ